MKLSGNLLLFILYMLPFHISFAESVADQAELDVKIAKSKADAAEANARAVKADVEAQTMAEKTQLELKKTKLEIEKTEASADEAQRTALKDSVATLSGMAVKGDTKDVSVTGNSIETQELTYRSVGKVVEKIIEDEKIKLCSASTKVILTDESSLPFLPIFDSTMYSFKSFQETYSSKIYAAKAAFSDIKTSYKGVIIEPKSGAAAVSMGLQVVAAVGAIVQTFKTTMAVTNAEVTVDTLALQAALTKQLIEKCSSNQPQLTSNLGLNLDSDPSEVTAIIDRVKENQSDGVNLESDINHWISIASQDLQKLNAIPEAKQPGGKVKTATTQGKNQNIEDKKKKIAASIATAEALLKNLKAMNDKATGFIEAFFITSDKQPISLLSSLLKYEKLSNAKLDSNSLFLILKTVASGGNTVMTNNFWRGPKIYHSGGAVLSYVLLSNQGVYLGGNTLDSHGGYVKFNPQEVSTIGNSWK